MTDNIPKDANILWCAVKKSWSVTKHLILCASYIIDGIAAAALAYFGIVGIWQAFSPIVECLWKALTGAIISVPWWCYAIVLALAAIPLYSALWCMARDLMEEDWKSEKANDSALALALALAFAFAFASAFAFAFAFALALALAFASTLPLIAIDPVDKITVWYYIFRFPGAYLNYWERMRNRDVLEVAREYKKEDA